MASSELVGWALGGIDREIAAVRERLSALTAMAAQLRGRGGIRGVASASDSGVSGGRRRRMTPEGRKRLSEMMKKRWAEAKRKKLNPLT